MIRQMREVDSDAVRQVDAAAFGVWWSQLKGEHITLPQRTRVNVLACLGKDPEGCFVAEEEGRVVGIIFSRTWGSVGWLGTFGVLPQYWGRGIGKRLIAASLDYLCQDADRVAGLETMPETPYNLGLYLRQGFQFCLPTLLLSKSLDPPATTDVSLPLWSLADVGTQERWLVDLQKTTDQVRSRLDYSKEITSTARYDLGETLVLADETKAVGLSIVWLAGSREGLGDELATVQILALHPAYTDEGAFRALLGATEALAWNRGKQKLAVQVNGRHVWALERLLEWGYRVERARVRMVLKGTDKTPTTDSYVNLASWAG